MAIVLDSITKYLVVNMDESPVIAPDFTSSYADHTSGLLTEGGNDGTLSNASETALVGFPTANTKRIVKNITIYNPNSTDITLTLKLVSSSNKRVIEKTVLTAFGTYKFTGDVGVAGARGLIGETGPIGAPSAGGSIFLTYLIPGASPLV